MGQCGDHDIGGVELINITVFVGKHVSTVLDAFHRHQINHNRTVSWTIYLKINLNISQLALT